MNVQFADGNFSSVDYTPTGLKWRAVDELGRASEVFYDGAGRPISTRSATLVGDGTWATTESYYDPAGNVIATVNPLGKQSDMTYDARNRKVREAGPGVRDPLGGEELVRPLVDTAYDGVAMSPRSPIRGTT